MLDAVVSRLGLFGPKGLVSQTKDLSILGGLVCLARLVWPERVSKPDKACLVPREIHLSN